MYRAFYSLIITLSIVMSFSIFGRDIVSLDRRVGEISCNDQAKLCEYRTIYLSPAKLIPKINAVLFPGSILQPSEGFITVIENDSSIGFWFYDDGLKDRFIALLPHLDLQDGTRPSNLVQVTTEIFSMSEGALSQVDARLSSGSSEVGDSPDWSFSNGLGILDLATQVGSNLFSALLGTSRVRTETQRVTKVTQLINDFGRIDYNHTTNIYISPAGSGQIKDELAGITIGGQVLINRFDPELVIIKNYSFKYGILTTGVDGENDKVTVLSVSTPQLSLIKGISSLVASSVTTERSNSSRRGLFSWGRDRNNLRDKMMVVTKAEAINFADYVETLKKYRQEQGLYREFSETAASKLPECNADSLKKALGSIKTYSYYTSAGDRRVGFYLNRDNACKSIIKTSIKISVRGGGAKIKKTLTIENLMLTGMQFEFKDRYLTKSHFKISISLKKFKTKTPPVKHKIYYNPETNSFIK